MAFEWLAPIVTSLAGAALVGETNRGAAQTAGYAAIQGAQVQADAINQASQLVTQYGNRALDVAQQRAQEADAIAREAEAEALRIVQTHGQAAAAEVLARAREARAVVEQANEVAQRIYQQVRAETQPGVSYLRDVVAHPDDLTPAQQRQLEDLRLGLANQIRGSSIAGSGRTTAALMKRVESDYVNDALDRNRQQAISAATTLAGPNLNAASQMAQTAVAGGRDIAGIETGAGRDVANIVQSSGNTQGNIVTQTGANRAGIATGLGTNQASTLNTMGTNQANLAVKSGTAQGDAIAKSGLMDAQADIATGNVMGKAIGDIGSAIVNEERRSRYGDRVSAIERRLGL